MSEFCLFQKFRINIHFNCITYYILYDIFINDLFVELASAQN